MTRLRKITGVLALVLPLAGCSENSPQAGQAEGAAVRSAQQSEIERLLPGQIRLRATIDWLTGGLAGNAGVAVRDLQDGWTTGFNENAPMPQQSVSKLWMALAVLDGADRGEIDLSAPVSVTRDDLTVFHQPIRKLVLRNGSFTTTCEDLLRRALTESDNTANDVLLRLAGGPEAIRAMLAEKGIKGIRFGPGERELQSSIAGLEWRPEFSYGKTFFYVRDDVPEPVRRQAFEGYLADPADAASPLAVVDALARLHAGELLSAGSTKALLEILGETKSGPKRLKGGLPPGWSILHKTGTGQVLEQVHSAYNDVGILTAPSGRSYAVAIMIGSTAEPVPDRMDFMHRIVAAIAEYEASLAGQAGETVSAPRGAAATGSTTRPL